MNSARIPATCAAALLLVCSGQTRARACDQLLTFESGQRPIRELFVSTTGSNTSGDGTPSKPFATIAFAASQAQPGDAVRVLPGVYAGGGFITDLHGAPNAPIWIGGADPNAPPVLQGSSEGLHFVRARYVVIHDLEIRNASANGLNCDDGGDYDNPQASRGLVIRNLYVHGIGGTGNQDGIKLSGIYEFAVIGCRIERAGGSGSGSGIDLVGCHDGVIAQCRFEEMSANAVQIKGGSRDVTVQRCWMREAGQRALNIGGSTGFEFFRPPLSATVPNAEAREIRVLANVIEGATCAFALVGAVDCVVAHNTIVTPHNWIFRILQETTSSAGYEFLPCGNNRVESNLVYFDRSDLSTYVNVGANTAPSTFVFRNNLWYAYDNPALSKPTLPAPETASLYGVNPLLVDPASGNYRLTSTSPAAKAGASPPVHTADWDGRCVYDPPAIGAFERLCIGDLDGDALVGDADLGLLLSAFGMAQGGGDINLNGVTDDADLGLLLDAFGGPCR